MCTKMEQPFYHDDLTQQRVRPGSGRPFLSRLQTPETQPGAHLADPYRSLKAPGRGAGTKGQRGSSYFSSQGSDTGRSAQACLHRKLERLIVPNSNGVITTTPHPPGTEQEGFADGFVKALDDLHKMNHVKPPNVSLGASSGPRLGPGASTPARSLSSLHQPQQLFPSLCALWSAAWPRRDWELVPDGHHQLPPTRATLSCGAQPRRHATVSPINMEDQERIKVERNAVRNRLAATKFRKRKLERTARLEDKVKTLKAETRGCRALLAPTGAGAQLKQKVMTHVSNGCQLTDHTTPMQTHVCPNTLLVTSRPVPS
uniref:Transcription factor JunB n=1 Tax=Ursus americanus TaxID=9643 RepID=A0A452RZN8_URSAM